MLWRGEAIERTDLYDRRSVRISIKTSMRMMIALSSTKWFAGDGFLRESMTQYVPAERPRAMQHYRMLSTVAMALRLEEGQRLP